MRHGVRLAIDVGSVRIGIAASDADGRIAVPVETVPRGKGDVERIVELARERDAFEVLVGWPIRMDGTPGPAVEHVAAFADRVVKAIAPTPMRAVDERLTTASAQRRLNDAGRSAKSSRAIIDQHAAVELLDNALAFERAQDVAPGRLIDPTAGALA